MAGRCGTSGAAISAIARPLQKKRKTGMVKRSTGKESRWATNLNHQISREIVEVVAAHGGTLHVERLKGIRERCQATAKVNRMIANWPFAQLLSSLKYKAAMAGVPVVEIDPRKTSQTCSRCGHAERGNRPSQAEFRCQVCGHQDHADRNAALVIRARATTKDWKFNNFPIS
jgi:putative transposase